MKLRVETDASDSGNGRAGDMARIEDSVWITRDSPLAIYNVQIRFRDVKCGLVGASRLETLRLPVVFQMFICSNRAFSLRGDRATDIVPTRRGRKPNVNYLSFPKRVA